MTLAIRRILTERDITISELANEIDLDQGQVSRFIGGARRANTDFLERVAQFLCVPVAELFEERRVPVVGYIGAGAEFYGVDDNAKGDGIYDVEAPVGIPANTVAVEVRGSSMVPAYNEGDLLFYSERRPDVMEFLNSRCICGLADGRILVKTPMRGSTPDLFTLTSFNAPPIEDIVLEWCAKIEWVKLR